MSFSFVQKITVGTTGTSGAMAFPGNVTSGNLIVVCINIPSSSGVTLTVSDTLGTTFTQAATVSYAVGAALARIYYGVLASSGANTVTVSLGGPNTDVFAASMEYSSAGAASFDNAQTNSGSSTTTGTCPQPTLANAPELTVAMLGLDPTGADAITGSGGSWVERDNDKGPLLTFRIQVEDWVASTGTTAIAWSWTVGMGTPNFGTVAASFRDAGGGGGVGGLSGLSGLSGMSGGGELAA